jgi:uncharacterized protein YbjT (DUF2867 family)
LRAVVFTLLCGVGIGASGLQAAGAPAAASASPASAVRASAHLAARIRGARILLIGATGNNGGDILLALDEIGARPRLLVRDVEKARARWPGEREWVQGDLTQPETLAAAVRGIDVVINAAATRQIDGPNGVDAVDLGGTRNLIAAAKPAGVRRIVFITGMVVGRPESDWPKPPMSRGFAAKREAEKLLIASGIDYVILRPTGILPRPAHRWSIDLVAQADYKASLEDIRMRAAGPPPDPNGPPPEGTISRGDLAEVAIVSAVHPQARDRVFVVTNGREPASQTWVRQLRRMPRE